jgi:hypothetical protein
MRLMTRTRAGYIVTLAVGVAIGTAVVGTAAAVQAAPAAKTVTHHLTLAASDLAPDGIHNAAEDYFNLWDPTTLSNTDTGRCFNAGLTLPPSSTLKSITFYYTRGSVQLFAELNRQNLAKHTATILADVTSRTATTPTYTAITKKVPALGATVNMATYAYSIGACPAGTSTFSGVDITYTTPG